MINLMICVCFEVVVEIEIGYDLYFNLLYGTRHENILYHPQKNTQNQQKIVTTPLDIHYHKIHFNTLLL